MEALCILLTGMGMLSLFSGMLFIDENKWGIWLIVIAMLLFTFVVTIVFPLGMYMTLRPV